MLTLRFIVLGLIVELASSQLSDRLARLQGGGDRELRVIRLPQGQINQQDYQAALYRQNEAIKAVPQTQFPRPTIRRVEQPPPPQIVPPTPQQVVPQAQALTQPANGGGLPPQLTQLLGGLVPGLSGGGAGGSTASNPFGGLNPGQLAQFAAQNPALAQQFLQNTQLLNNPAGAGGQGGALGAFPAGFAEAAAAAAGGGQSLGPNSGILGVFSQLTQKLAQNSGIGDLLTQQGALGAAQNPQAALGAIFGGAGAQSDSPNSAAAAGPSIGLPRLPGLPLLPQGIPKDQTGSVDMVRLMSDITKRVTNGTTLSDVLPPNRIQGFADNITNVLLPTTPGVDLSKFMGRWFEGINSPRASEQRCVVHHYGGLTDNHKTATFTALKIYREGSEFGQVRYSIGYAFRGGHKDGMLQMHTSESSEQSPYWIYKVGPEGADPFGNPQYDYAIVSNWVKYPVTVLVRDPDIFKQKYEEEVLRYLEDEGFINGFVRAFNMLQPVSYNNCQYSDSTFQVFGK